MYLMLVLAAFVAFVGLPAVYIQRKRRSNKPELKQGAYGKVPIHKHSIVEQLCHPDEVFAVLKHMYNRKRFQKQVLNTKLPQAIWTHLDSTSRSFALVIRVLPAPELADAVCVFYLILRALDTVEDETELDKFASLATGKETPLEAKVRLLQCFHTCFFSLDAVDFPVEAVVQSNIGFGSERDLLKDLPMLVSAYHGLSAAAQRVVLGVCKEMACGMSEYVGRDMSLGTRDLEDYDRYCHIVAGLVGRGLTELFVQLGYESSSPLLLDNWNEMGLMLQRTNITRDFCEDFADHRLWWPKTVTDQFTTDLSTLKEDVSCLNCMVRHALELVPNAIDYLQGVENGSIFAFCSVPQIMAVATLQECYANKLVYTGVVKIRSGLGAKLLSDMLSNSDGKGIQAKRRVFQSLVISMVSDISQRASALQDEDTVQVCNRILSKCTAVGGRKPRQTSGLQIAASYLFFGTAAWAFRQLIQV